MAPHLPDTIEHLPTAQLEPYARNSRTHSIDQVGKVADSIRRFGFTNPVLVRGATIIAGHGRVMAAKALDMATVPVIRLDHLTEDEARAYVIADNKLAELAGWDEDLLALEMRELQGHGFDLGLTGFTDKELREMLFVEPEAQADADAAPAVQEVVITKPGDVWVMGQHRLMCGDSTSAQHVQALCMGGGVDMWLTDPPYNVAYEGGTKERLTIENDSMGDEQFREFLKGAYAAANAAMRPGAVFYIWHADMEGFNFRAAAVDVGWKVRQLLIWKKSSLVMGRQDYHAIHEPCLYGWKEGAGHTWSSDRKQTTVLEFEKPSRNGEHPTMKPVALFEYQMLNNTGVGDTVLDSFGGSGTTLIAAEKNGRIARLMELDPKYCDVIVRRWQAFTGSQAKHEATGRAFGA